MFELDDLQSQRLAKAERLRAMGIDPYPPRCVRTHTAAEALERYDDLQGETLTLMGRIMAIRVMGKSTFAHIADAAGRIQLYFKVDALGEEAYDLVKRMLDIGDFITATGTLFKTRTGETTLLAQGFEMKSKSLHPLPEKWHGLTDVEKRYRQRYVDLIVNEDVRKVFVTRARIITAMRRFLDDRGFLEVETPILQPLYGGAAARPFVTYHNALDRSLYLRIAVELYLKRLIVGGYERVYEIGKNFRNEGIDTRHNPEFTMMELYQACADYDDIMALTEEMISTIAQEALGTTTVAYAGETIGIAPPWPRRTLRQAIIDYSGVDYEQYPTQQTLYRKVRELGVHVAPTTGRGKLIDELLKTYVVPNLVQPTFLIDYPIELSPLAKKKPEDPNTVERFQAFAGRLELGNAFTELNDPMDQYERFLEQKKQQEAGDEEAHPIDEDFVTALMYGMPPTGGLGVGVDRLTMLLTDNQSIRDVILFPQLRT